MRGHRKAHKALVSVDSMIRDYQDGMSVRAIAAKYKAGYGMVHRRLTQAGVMRPRNGVGGMEEAPDVAEWARMYEAGAGLRAIAAKYHVGHMKVRRYLMDAGVTLRPGVGGKPKKGKDA